MERDKEGEGVGWVHGGGGTDLASQYPQVASTAFLKPKYGLCALSLAKLIVFYELPVLAEQQQHFCGVNWTRN